MGGAVEKKQNGEIFEICLGHGLCTRKWWNKTVILDKNRGFKLFCRCNIVLLWNNIYPFQGIDEKSTYHTSRNDRWPKTIRKGYVWIKKSSTDEKSTHHTSSSDRWPKTIRKRYFWIKKNQKSIYFSIEVLSTTVLINWGHWKEHKML